MIDSATEVDLQELNIRLQHIEQLLQNMEQQRAIKEFYSTAEVAEIMGRAEWTVREWCRNSRINARKRPSGRGPNGEWSVSHEELLRLQNEGLLPLEKRYATYDR